MDPASLALLAGGGAVIGFLLAVLGAGGSILLLPLLVSGASLPTREAVPLSLLVVMLLALASGTSLLLIAVNALVALAALGHWPAASLPLVAPLLVGGGIGASVGQRLAPQLNDRRLRQGFSLLLISSALLSGWEAWRRHQNSTPSPSPIPSPALPEISRPG